jgi:hypothetical protein
MSDVDLLRDFDGVVDLDAEIADGAFDLRVPEPLILERAERTVGWSSRAWRTGAPETTTGLASGRLASGTRRFACRVWSVSSNRTGLPVFFWRTVARSSA